MIYNIFSWIPQLLLMLSFLIGFRFAVKELQRRALPKSKPRSIAEVQAHTNIMESALINETIPDHPELTLDWEKTTWEWSSNGEYAWETLQKKDALKQTGGSGSFVSPNYKDTDMLKRKPPKTIWAQSAQQIQMMSQYEYAKMRQELLGAHQKAQPLESWPRCRRCLAGLNMSSASKDGLCLSCQLPATD